MKKKYENSGITLIALIVTMIVLLILSGISMSVLTGENGILNKAGEAKQSTEKMQIKEEVMEKWYQVEKEAIHNNYSDETKLQTFENKLKKEDNKAKITTEEKNVKVEYKGQIIKIPKN